MGFNCMEAAYILARHFDTHQFLDLPKKSIAGMVEKIPIWWVECPKGLMPEIMDVPAIPEDKISAYKKLGIKVIDNPVVKKGFCVKTKHTKKFNILRHDKQGQCIDFPIAAGTPEEIQRFIDNNDLNYDSEESTNGQVLQVVLAATTVDRFGNPINVDTLRIVPNHEAEPSHRYGSGLDDDDDEGTDDEPPPASEHDFASDEPGEHELVCPCPLPDSSGE